MEMHKAEENKDIEYQTDVKFRNGKCDKKWVLKTRNA